MTANVPVVGLRFFCADVDIIFLKKNATDIRPDVSRMRRKNKS